MDGDVLTNLDLSALALNLNHYFYHLTVALRACRSDIFERNRENVCKPLDILTRFYEYPRSAIFEK